MVPENWHATSLCVQAVGFHKAVMATLWDTAADLGQDVAQAMGPVDPAVAEQLHKAHAVGLRWCRHGVAIGAAAGPFHSMHLDDRVLAVQPAASMPTRLNGPPRFLLRQSQLQTHSCHSSRAHSSQLSDIGGLSVAEACATFVDAASRSSSAVAEPYSGQQEGLEKAVCDSTGLLFPCSSHWFGNIPPYMCRFWAHLGRESPAGPQVDHVPWWFRPSHICSDRPLSKMESGVL